MIEISVIIIELQVNIKHKENRFRSSKVGQYRCNFSTRVLDTYLQIVSRNPNSLVIIILISFGIIECERYYWQQSTGFQYTNIFRIYNFKPNVKLHTVEFWKL